MQSRWPGPVAGWVRKLGNVVCGAVVEPVCGAGVQSAKERLTKMLSSKELKATILEMAGAGEIDVALLQLLQQNIDGAEASGQKDAAAFMGKIRDFAARYVIVPERSKESEEAAVKAAVQAEQAARAGKEGGTGGGTGGSGLIMP